MRILVLSDDLLWKELTNNGVKEGVEVIRIADLDEVSHQEADAFIDLLFEDHRDRIAILQQLSPMPVFINSVLYTLQETDSSFIRFNGWPTFLQSALVEASGSEQSRNITGKVFAGFNKTIEWVDDDAGFITPRIISMIINEAYLALEEGVSTRQDIDTAMKLGTNYPFGPFEWSERIGPWRIKALLDKLSVVQKRYLPAQNLIDQ